MMTVWVVGNAVWDVQIPVTQFPVPGETVLACDVARSPGGKGANQAVIMARFGCPVQFVTVLGADAEGDTLLAALQHEGLAGLTAFRAQVPTDQSWIIVDGTGENMIISTHAAIAHLAVDQVKKALNDARPGDFLVLQGNADTSTTLLALRHGKARGMRTVFSPAPAWPEARDAWPDCDLVILNQSEAASLLGTQTPDHVMRQLTAAGAQSVVMTCGAQGACYRDANGAEGAIPATPTRVTDTAGAGDTVAAATIAGLARGLDLDKALRLAMDAAAITVARAGTFSAFPTPQDAQRLWPGRTGPTSHLITTEQACQSAASKHETG